MCKSDNILWDSFTFENFSLTYNKVNLPPTRLDRFVAITYDAEYITLFNAYDPQHDTAIQDDQCQVQHCHLQPSPMDL